MVRKLSVLAGCVLALYAPRIGAQGITHPDFSGTWVLDVARSDAAQSTPTAATYQVRQQHDTITYDRAASSLRGETSSHVVLGTDGKPWKNVVAQNGADVTTTSIVSWVRDTLVIQSSGEMNASTVDTYERWSIAADRRSLLMFREVSVNGQVYASTNLWFNRKESQ
jgi:hypothetical protein